MKKTTIILYCVAIIGGCATQNRSKFSPEKSYLYGSSNNTQNANTNSGVINKANQESIEDKFRFIPPFKIKNGNLRSASDIIGKFSNQKTIQVSADGLPLIDYLHHVFGEQLKLSYVLDDAIKNDTNPITLNLQQSVTERKLFTLTEDLLIQRDYVIRVDEGIFYVHKSNAKGGRADVIYGYGKEEVDVPQSSLEVIQLVPFEYGVQVSLANTLRQMLGIKASLDQTRSSLTLQGKRKDILKALSFIQIMDQPALRDRHIALYRSTFVSTVELVSKLEELLAQEGISVGSGKSIDKAVSIVELDKQGVVVFFANNQEVLKRAKYWSSNLDKPIKTLEKQYFVYQPRFARAVDLGDSLMALVGGRASSSGRENTSATGNRTSASAENRRSKSQSPKSKTNANQEMNIVVDERANALIFYTSGNNYQQLIPLIKRLDTQPNQVMLEVMIAEVTLTDEFKQGVEFALNQGSYGLSTQGAFMGEGFGGLSYLLSGSEGQLAMNLFQSNSLVNILSRPTLVVRDGVDAYINVGTDIPIIGETTSDPIAGERQTTKVDYRKTGVELNVRPTVNAQGVVILEIQQKISNEVESGSTVSGSPSIFERSISTEVIAKNGQTIMLGGLISENRTKRKTKVPLLGDLPFVGSLFRADTDAGDKTELVVLVTPRIIDSTTEWDEILDKFNQSVTELNIN